MADARFEHELGRLFAEAPPPPDAEFFALRVRERLDRDWTLRRMFVSLAGAAAGAVALWRVAGEQVVLRLEEAVSAPVNALLIDKALIANVAPVLRAVPVPMEVVWLAGGLVLLAAGMLVTRMVDEV